MAQGDHQVKPGQSESERWDHARGPFGQVGILERLAKDSRHVRGTKKKPIRRGLRQAGGAERGEWLEPRLGGTSMEFRTTLSWASSVAVLAEAKQKRYSFGHVQKMVLKPVRRKEPTLKGKISNRCTQSLLDFVRKETTVLVNELDEEPDIEDKLAGLSHDRQFARGPMSFLEIKCSRRTLDFVESKTWKDITGNPRRVWWVQCRTSRRYLCAGLGDRHAGKQSRRNEHAELNVRGPSKPCRTRYLHSPRPLRLRISLARRPQWERWRMQVTWYLSAGRLPRSCGRFWEVAGLILKGVQV